MAYEPASNKRSDSERGQGDRRVGGARSEDQQSPLVAFATRAHFAEGRKGNAEDLKGHQAWP